MINSNWTIHGGLKFKGSLVWFQPKPSVQYFCHREWLIDRGLTDLQFCKGGELSVLSSSNMARIVDPTMLYDFNEAWQSQILLSSWKPYRSSSYRSSLGRYNYVIVTNCRRNSTQIRVRFVIRSRERVGEQRSVPDDDRDASSHGSVGRARVIAAPAHRRSLKRCSGLQKKKEEKNL